MCDYCANRPSGLYDFACFGCCATLVMQARNGKVYGKVLLAAIERHRLMQEKGFNPVKIPSTDEIKAEYLRLRG